MAFNLCPCVTLQKGVKILAIIDGILSIVNLLITILLFALLVSHPDHFDLSSEDVTTYIAIIVIDATFLIVQICMAVKLYNGAKANDARRCRVWLIVNTIIDMIEIFSSFMSGETINGVSFRLFMIIIVYKAYVISVVLTFIKKVTKTEAIHVSVVYNCTQYASPSEISHHTVVPHQSVYYTAVETNFQDDKSSDPPPYHSLTEKIAP